MEKRQLVGWSHVIITGNVPKAFDCAELTFVNAGTTLVNIVSGATLPLQPGQAVTYPAFPGEVNHTSYNFTFPGGDSNGNLLVALVKNYL